jgi:OFA family oxalate/formate antiporter-like MFS transporter
MSEPVRVPGRAWTVVAAGTAVNLCLGILYAWSVWKSVLVPKDRSLIGTPMNGMFGGWTYLSDSQATLAYSVCGLTFAICMIPGGRIQDRYGPRVGATAGGVCLAAGCLIAGSMRNLFGLIVGFGLLGGIGMGLGYAAATPAAVRWFGSYRRGLVVGLVVGGYGAAAAYISPLGKVLLGEFGLSGSFLAFAILFAMVIIVAGSQLVVPPKGYMPPSATPAGDDPVRKAKDWEPAAVRRTWQFYALVGLMFGAAQSGLLVIVSAAQSLKDVSGSVPFFAANDWLLVAFGGVVNAAGRVGTGFLSDRIGRANAYALNGLLAVVCLLLIPTVVANESVPLLFLTFGVVYWQYGGGLALLPAFTADYFGTKNLGTNYGLVFLGWGLAFFVPQLAGVVKDATGSLSPAFYLSAGILAACVVLSRYVTKPGE